MNSGTPPKEPLGPHRCFLQATVPKALSFSNKTPSIFMQLPLFPAELTFSFCPHFPSIGYCLQSSLPPLFSNVNEFHSLRPFTGYAPRGTVEPQLEGLRTCFATRLRLIHSHIHSHTCFILTVSASSPWVSKNSLQFPIELFLFLACLLSLVMPWIPRDN